MRRRFKRVFHQGLTFFLGYLPTSIRHRLIRSQLNLIYDLPEGLHFKIARTDKELQGAFALLHDSYVDMGYMLPHPSGLRVTFYHLLPSTTTVVGIYKDEVVATLSIIRDSSHGLPMDSAFSLSRLRKEGGKLAEISSLAVHKEFRNKGGLALFPLFRYLWIYCRFYFAVDYIVMATHPRLSEMFDALVLFSPLEEKQVPNYGFANGAPAVSKVLDLRKAPMLYAMKYGDKPDAKNLYRYMVPPDMGGVEFPAICLPNREDFRISDPVMTPELLRTLFVEKAQALENLNEEQIRTVVSHYSTPSYTENVPQILRLTEKIQLSLRRPAEPRYDVQCTGQLRRPFAKDPKFPMLVTNVSESGLGGKATGNLEEGQTYRITLAVAPLEVLALTVIVRWQNPQGLIGLEILRSSDRWKSFVRRLQTTSLDEAA